MTYPYVLSEAKTIQLLRQGKSIARFGDGELNICFGYNSKLQGHSKELEVRLRQILKSDSDNCLVGIPNIATNTLPDKKRLFWKKYLDSKYSALYKADKEYASAFITRPDSVPAINSEAYYNSVFSLWENKNVLLVEGQKSNFDRLDIFNVASSVSCYFAPDEDAFTDYTQILKRVTEIARTLGNCVVIISLGPTATVLAYDLAEVGIQALDLGHLAFLYEKCFVRGLEH